jgi:putative hydrolase of the HAD superfamily
MTKKIPGVRNIVFDLGGVIVDLSVDKTIQSFSRLAGLNPQQVDDIYTKSPEFLSYEKGLMSDAEFRDTVRSLFGVNATDVEIDACWNAMILGLPPEKLSLVFALHEYFNVYLLSNTNGIHIDYVNNSLLPPGSSKSSLDDYFHCAYYSHTMHKRKPDAEIFEQVLTDSKLSAEETLFLDDNMANIEGAKAVGIRAVHVDTPDFILAYFA